MNSYQKLKAKNKQLSEVIRVLTETPESPEAKEILFFYNLNKRCEETIMFGSPISTDTTAKGILSQITNSKPQ